MVDKCIICETRPQKNGVLCSLCASKINSETQAQIDRKIEARYYIAYHGIVVGLFPNGQVDGQQTYLARRLNLDVEKLPKSRTLNVDNYLPGYTREQVKKFKATCLSLGHA